MLFLNGPDNMFLFSNLYPSISLNNKLLFLILYFAILSVLLDFTFEPFLLFRFETLTTSFVILANNAKLLLDSKLLVALILLPKLFTVFILLL